MQDRSSAEWYRENRNHYNLGVRMRTAAITRLSPVMLLLIAACAVPTTGVVPRGDGYFTVTRQGEGLGVTNDQLRAAALKEAGARCSAASKPLKVIHVKDIPAGPLGRWPESEVLFRCE